MIKVVCFDFDGVICKGEYYSKRIEREYGIPHKEFVKVLDGPWKKECQLGKKTMRMVWEKQIKEWKLTLTIDQFFNKWFGEEWLDKEIIYLTDELRKKVKVFLLTNNPKERMDYYNKRDKLYSHFDEVIISGAIGAYKTSKKAAELICRLAKAKPEEVLVVDNDTIHLSLYGANDFNLQIYYNNKQLKEDLVARI